MFEFHTTTPNDFEIRCRGWVAWGLKGEGFGRMYCTYRRYLLFSREGSKKEGIILFHVLILRLMIYHY